MSAITFGNVTPPAIARRDINPTLNTAWNNLGQRRGLFVVLHRMEGTLWGTDGYFRNEARHKARTDYGVDNTSGEMLRWTDPLGIHSGYASGPWTSPPGDGIALVAKLGQGAINRDGISVEIGGSYGSPVSATAWARIARLIAFWADYNEIAWNVWPINPKTGLTFLYWHNEFNGGKQCPGAVVMAYTTQLIEDVRRILRDAQAIEVTGSVGAPVRPIPPTVPAPIVAPPDALVLPQGVTLAMVAGWFGTVQSNGDRAMTFAFDPAGPLSKLWLAHGRETGEWPQLASVTGTPAGRLFRFDGGWTVRGTADGTLEEVAA